MLNEEKIDVSKHLKFLETKLVEYLNFPKEHPESNVKHTEHKMTVLLPQLKRAISKCKDGTFQTCDDCGDKIPNKRIKAVPTAIRCVKCQEKFENFNKKNEEKPNEKKANPILLRIFSHYTVMTVFAWAKDQNPSKKSMLNAAFDNWEKAVSKTVLKIENKNSQNFFDNLSKKKK